MASWNERCVCSLAENKNNQEAGRQISQIAKEQSEQLTSVWRYDG